jgi:Protein of unknown function (DUF3592)
MTQWINNNEPFQDIHPAWHSTCLVPQAVAVLCLLCGVVQYVRLSDFEAHAIETTGTVLDKWEGWRSKHGHTSKHVRVKFIARDGSQHTYGEEIYDRTAWNRMAINSQVPVWYVPDDPANHAFFERHR